MIEPNKPAVRPANPRFSSGPTTKRPGWSLKALNDATLGRSHRSKLGKSKLKLAIDLTREVLEIPDDYRIGIVPASDTGAVEMALWSLLGERGVDVAAWESFGADWITDVFTQLKLDDTRKIFAEFGKLPDLSQLDFDRDVVFTWNGTTSGVRVPNGDFIPDDRKGLTICDATSAAFAQNLDFSKLDVTTFSWQKVMGGEAAHGMLVLSPRAVERLENYSPPWPLPKIFRLTKSGKLNEGIFEGATINTPSMLCVEDYIDTLTWGKSIGGLAGLKARADNNLNAIANWVDQTSWVGFLAEDPETRSNTGICLKIVDPEIVSMDRDKQAAFAKSVVSLLDSEGIAYDIGSYAKAPPGIRIWGAATVELSDIEALLPWLDWAYVAEKQRLNATA